MPIRIIAFLLCLPLCLPAQPDTLWEDSDMQAPAAVYEDGEYATDRVIAPYHAPPLPPMPSRSVENSAWEKAGEGLDYSKDLPEPAKAKKDAKDEGASFDALNWTAATQRLGSILQGLAVLLAVAGIAYGIFRMLKAPRNRQISRDGVQITIDNLEAYLHESDIERFLREALARGDYAQAVRLYYLQIIKSLSERNAIEWSREKTNRDYLREMRGHPLGAQFRSATFTYERFWYGNQPLTGQSYADIEPQFRGLLDAI